MASKLYDRRYRISITFARGNSVAVEELRCRFNFIKTISQTSQFGHITIYNLSPERETDIFKNAKYVTVEAGYQNGAYGIIFQGQVRIPTRGKENGVDRFITLGVLDGDSALNLAFCNAYTGAGQLPTALVNTITRSSKPAFDVEIRGDLDEGQGKTERGKTFFGQPKEFLQNIAANTNSTFYFNNGKGVMSKLSQSPPAVVPFLNYQSGMVGVPHQEDKGIAVRTFIRPDIDVDTWVKINNSEIILAESPFAGALNQNVLDLDGVYRVIEIKVSGDTRGNEWYYDLKLLSQSGALPNIVGLSGQHGF